MQRKSKVPNCMWYTPRMRHLLWAAVLLACSASVARAQACPQSSASGSDVESEGRTLEGKLAFHDGIRKWFELKLDQAQCGQASTELLPKGEDWTPLQVLRGCHVRSTGAMGFSTTGYYSLDTYQTVEKIEPTGTCARQPVFPDYSKAEPATDIRQYRVDMLVDYEPGDHPIRFRVRSASKELQPWQAYASYTLTGGFVLYGRCGRVSRSTRYSEHRRRVRRTSMSLGTPATWPCSTPKPRLHPARSTFTWDTRACGRGKGEGYAGSSTFSLRP